MKYNWNGKRARAGSIEGMPLQMMIMVIVAVLVVTVLMGYIYLLSDTDTVIDKIIVSPDEVHLSAVSGTPSITVTVLDTEGNKVENTVLVITGCNVDLVEDLKTGTRTIQLTGISLPYGRPVGYISIIAQRSGMGKKSTEVVVFQTL